MKSRIINIRCSRCGSMYSEESGHTCNENYVRYRRKSFSDNMKPISESEFLFPKDKLEGLDK